MHRRGHQRDPAHDHRQAADRAEPDLSAHPHTGVAGRVDAAFAPLADLFTQSVASGEERGALCVRIEGRIVLDLCGGAADPETNAPWQADTLACCFSVTKGVFALLTHALEERGLLSLDAPVATYWPDFAAGGKGTITVFDVLTHRAGLPAVAGEVAPGLLYDQPAMVAALAASAPVVPPQAAPVYHNMTYGTLLAEIIRRATGRDARKWSKLAITSPLGADFAIGLSKFDQKRTARLTQQDNRVLFDGLTSAPDTLFARSMRFFPEGEDFNSVAWREAVVGSGSGHATAQGIARIYEALIGGTLLSPERRAWLPEEVCASDGPDPILGMPLRFGAGFELSTPEGIDLGPGPRTLGYWGSGGATGFADPDAALAFGYVTGHKDATLGSSPRARALIRELYACL